MIKKSKKCPTYLIYSETGECVSPSDLKKIEKIVEKTKKATKKE